MKTNAAELRMNRLREIRKDIRRKDNHLLLYCLQVRIEKAERKDE